MTGHDDAFTSLQTALANVYADNLLAERSSLVRAALDVGFLDRCGEPLDRAEVVAMSSAPDDVVEALLDGLVVHGVLDAVDGTHVVVTEGWRSLCDRDGRTLLRDALELGEARARMLRGALDGRGWTDDPHDLVAMARGVTWDPATDFAVRQRRRAAERVPEFAAAVASGGRYLELGCGVGGALIALVRAFPGVTAVGVELSPELAAVAARSARELDVADRVRVVQGDAVEFRDSTDFDVCFWSQFFFPTAARPGTLSTALGALRPGGVLVAPAPDVRLPAGGPYDDDARDAAGERVLWATWGVPARTPDELVAEVARAGFVDVHLVAGDFVQTLVARAPA